LIGLQNRTHASSISALCLGYRRYASSSLSFLAALRVFCWFCGCALQLQVDALGGSTLSHHRAAHDQSRRQWNGLRWRRQDQGCSLGTQPRGSCVLVLLEGWRPMFGRRGVVLHQGGSRRWQRREAPVARCHGPLNEPSSSELIASSLSLLRHRVEARLKLGSLRFDRTVEHATSQVRVIHKL
jgi:hypothetical protein